MTIKHLISKVFYLSGVSEIFRRTLTRNKRFVLVMHGVAKNFYPELPKNVQPHHCHTEIIKTLTWLKNRFVFLSPDDFCNTNKPGMLLTFDDGFANNYEVLLPVLEDFKAPAIFFITLQHVLNPSEWLTATRKIALQAWEDLDSIPPVIAHDFYDGMTVTQLRICAEHPLITIGSHTFSHPFLSKLTENEMEYEIIGSKRKLEDLISQPVDYFAYPTGDYDLRAVETVKKAGYKAAFAVDPNQISEFRFEIPRVSLYDSDEAYLGLKLSGLHRFPIKAHQRL
jgi:peptidoglycan/xylan/chitin deacetylase (PgdA/CDA1 family)